MTTYNEAVDEIFSAFWSKWRVEALALIGYIPEVRWQGVKEADVPDSGKYWARVSVQTVDESQSTLGACVGQEGKSRYESIGLVTVQLFCPQSDIQAGAKGRQLAELTRNIFRTSTTNVWFKNAGINELSPEPSWFRFNIISEYEFSEIY